MGKMSREKGKRGEREVAALLKEYGFEARRGQQFRGGADSPDVVHNIPNVHIEVKLREKLSLYPTLEQALSETFDGYPVVFHRRNGKRWVVVLYADDFLRVMEEMGKW